MEKVVIFGATGMTGECVLQEALNLGIKVKLLIRNPSRLPSKYHEKVEIIQGDILNSQDVDKAVTDTDGIVVALGTRNNLDPTTDLSTGLKNILESMKKHKIKAISVCLSAFLFYEPEKVPERFKYLNEEHNRMLQLLKSSDVNYVAVFPPHIADTPKGEYVVKNDDRPSQGPEGRIVSKWDLAAFLVHSLSKEEHYRHIVGICSKVTS